MGQKSGQTSFVVPQNSSTFAPSFEREAVFRY